MLVLAGPGSGKTKVLTCRIKVLIEEKNISPENILVITFSKKAAIEMQQRFSKLTYPKSYPVNFGTFHSVFYKILRSTDKYSDISILTTREKQQYIMSIGEAYGIGKASFLSWQEDILSKISYRKNVSCKETNFEQDEENELIMLLDAYDKKCKEEGKIDFDDILLYCRDLLYKHENILRKWQNVYKYILIDEFQDINDVQYDILRLLAGDRRNVFCVGDDDQSIYAFRGARPELLQKFTKQFYDCKIVNLDVNYRCAKNIVGAANTLIINNTERMQRQMQEVFNNKYEGHVEIAYSENTVDQGDYVCNKILELKELYGYNDSDFAVLFRSGHCAKMFENIAIKKDLSLTTNEKCFNLFEVTEIKIIMSYIKIALGIGNRADYLLAVNSPPRNISREAFSCEDKSYIKQLFEYYESDANKAQVVDEFWNDATYARCFTPFAYIVFILKKVGLDDYFALNYKKSSNYSYEEIKDMILDVARGFDDLKSFAKYYDSCLEGDSSNTEIINRYNNTTKQKGVALLSAHASKGLEYKVVFIIGLQEGLFPHNKNLHGKSVEEERRLMYVAMTRAKERLYLCALNIEHGKQKSRFIDEILENQSFISSYSSLSKNSSNASATASYSSSSSI